MDNTQAASNFIDYVLGYCATMHVTSGTILLVCDSAHLQIANAIVVTSHERIKSTLSFSAIELKKIDDYVANSDAINSAALIFALYDNATLANPTPQGNHLFRKLKALSEKELTQQLRRIYLLLDIKEHFQQVYSFPAQEAITINEQLINLAKNSNRLVINDKIGGEISAPLTVDNTWSNSNGDKIWEIMPSEISTYSPKLTGQINFTGLILTALPFTIKYGLVTTPLKLIIENSEVIKIEHDNNNLVSDFDYYLARHPANRRVAELGIGTNKKLTTLYPINAPFQERHAGFHLVLGGTAPESLHLDLVFANSEIFFDDQIIFDGIHFNL